MTCAVSFKRFLSTCFCIRWAFVAAPKLWTAWAFFALMAFMIEFCGKFISSRLSYIIHDFVKALAC
jgi:hypothetical protein